MGKQIVYAYVMTNDSGFAPCVDRNWLTLACCKPGIRRTAGKEAVDMENDVWVIGLCGRGLAKESGRESIAYSPVYIAQVEAVTMKQYYSNPSRGRQDDVYTETLAPVWDEKGEHPHNEAQRAADRNGEFVLCAKRFVYWGDVCGTKCDDFMKDLADICNQAEHAPRSTFVDRDAAAIIDTIQRWTWFPQKGHCLYHSNNALHGEMILEEKDDEEPKITRFVCGCGRVRP